MDLRANTAVDVLIGPFVDSTDGDTDETGLTLSQADITLSKNGQALAQKNDITAAAHDANGYYNCELDATDTNTEGNLVLRVHESGALNVRHEYNILAEAAWDSLYVAKDTGFMDVNVKAVSEDTTAADNLESACDNYSATRGLSGTALPAAAADAAGGLPISDAGGLDLDAMNTNINDIETDTADMQPRVVAIEVDTGEIGTAGAGLTNINLPNQTMDIVGNITGNLSGSVGSVTGAAGSVTGAVGSVAGNVDGSVGSLAAQAKLDVNAECDTALSDYDGPTNTEFEVRTPTAAQLTYITDHAATAPPVTFSGGSTTTAILTNVDGAGASSVDDFYNGRILIFNTGTLNEQATDITDYDGGTTTATITAVTTAVTGSHTAILV